MTEGVRTPDRAVQATPDDAIRAMLESACFRRAPTLHKLLEYLWRNHQRELSEYSIATEVLQRREDFDPKIDSVVRVHILRLRQKLKEYYEGEGATARVRFAIPAGSLVLKAEDVAAPEPEAAAVEGKAGDRKWLWHAATGILLVVAVSGWWQAAQRRSAGPQRLPEFWAHAVGNGRPTRLVLPTPVFLQWPATSLRVRDYRLNEFESMVQSPELQPLIQKFGQPRLSQSYSVGSASVSAGLVGQFLAMRGHPTGVYPEGKLSLDAFAGENLIFLGVPHTSRWLNGLLEKCNFQMDSNGHLLTNTKPEAGEPKIYRQVNHSETRRVVPHLMALLPGKDGQTRVLVLSGQTTVLATFLTTPGGLEEVEKSWRQKGKPGFFEMVVLAEMEGDNLIKAHVASARVAQPIH